MAVSPPISPRASTAATTTSLSSSRSSSTRAGTDSSEADARGRNDSLETELRIVGVELLVKVIEPALVGRIAHRVNCREPQLTLISLVGIADELRNPGQRSRTERLDGGGAHFECLRGILGPGAQRIDDAVALGLRRSGPAREARRTAASELAAAVLTSLSSSSSRSRSRAATGRLRCLPECVGRPRSDLWEFVEQANAGERGEVEIDVVLGELARQDEDRVRDSRGIRGQACLDRTGLLAPEVGEQHQLGGSWLLSSGQPVEEVHQFAGGGGRHEPSVSAGRCPSASDFSGRLRSSVIAARTSRLPSITAATCAAMGRSTPCRWASARATGAVAAPSTASPMRSMGLLRGLSLSEQLAEAAVAAQRRETRGRQVADAGEALERERTGADGQRRGASSRPVRAS